MNLATVFGINIESVSPPDDAGFGGVSCSSGPADSSPARSYGLQLWRQRSGEALEIEDPADQVRFLADPSEPTPAEATQTVPVFTLAEEFLDLLPTALRQSVPDAPHAHAHPRVRPSAVAGVHSDVRLDVLRQQGLDEGFAEKALVGPERPCGKPQPAFRSVQQGEAAAGLRRTRAIDLGIEPQQDAVAILHEGVHRVAGIGPGPRAAFRHEPAVGIGERAVGR